MVLNYVFTNFEFANKSIRLYKYRSFNWSNSIRRYNRAIRFVVFPENIANHKHAFHEMQNACHLREMGIREAYRMDM